ncbi:MAG: lytic transglycosylase domain-containing protein [Muribaculaceae bacterium]|nr:lytic transglycosylase domain-containing protein [Muribaculaceae bacterium]
MMHKKLCVAVMLALCAMVGHAQLKNGQTTATYDKGTTNAVFNVTANPDIPTQVTFAGEKISLDRLDMAERYDRELTSIIYGQTSTLLCMKRANRHFPVLAPILKAQGVPSDFLYLACTESTMDFLAYSSAKAAGLWQLLAGTAQQYGLEVTDEVDERYDPELSTVAACKYLKAAYSRYGSWTTVAASYNAGMGKISSELTKQGVERSFDLYLVQETSRYVFRIMAYKTLMENPKRYGYRLRAEQLYQPVSYTKVEVTGAVASWVDWAKAHGITYAQLREANPWIRSTKLTNSKGRTYQVKVPLAADLYRSKRQSRTYDKNWVVN